MSNIRKTSCVCGPFRFIFGSILFILVIIVGVMSAVILIMSSFFAAELCPYISESTGVDQSDYVINGAIADFWPPISNVYVDIPQPRNVLYTLRTTCNPDKDHPITMLLPSLGVSRLIDLSSMSSAPEFRQNIDKTLE